MRQSDPKRGQALVAVMTNGRDWGILHEQGWYRIPKKRAPREWPPRWLAFYQTRKFGQDKYAVNYYAQVREIRTATRIELLPGQANHPRRNHEYHQVFVDSLVRLPRPIPSLRWRRITFIPTTWERLMGATEINELYHGNPLEESLWTELRRVHIAAEREYNFKARRARYFLDFAVFCSKGHLDIETDGDSYHANPDRAATDNVRNNTLASAGWQVLRFSTKQIREHMQEYCIPNILETVNELGGVINPPHSTPYRYITTPEGIMRQGVLFEERAPYNWD